MSREPEPDEPRNGKRIMGLILSAVASLLVLGIAGTIVGLAKHGEKISSLEAKQEGSDKRIDGSDKRTDGLERRLERIESKVDEVLRRMPK